MRKLGLQGNATIDFIVDTQGTVQNAQAVNSTHPELADAAVAAVREWKFQPGRKAGNPVAVHMQVPIVFTLNDAPTRTGANRPQNVPWF